MTDAGVLGTLALVGGLVVAPGSVPLALTAVLLARRVRPFGRALTYAGGGVGLLVVPLAVGVATIFPEAGVVVVAVAAALWGLPLWIARTVQVRRGVDPERALRRATLSLPVALFAALPIVFGDFSRHDITFRTGLEAAVSWTALALVVVPGPAAVALGLGRLDRWPVRARRRDLPCPSSGEPSRVRAKLHTARGVAMVDTPGGRR